MDFAREQARRESTGVIRGTLIEHDFTKSKTPAKAEDRCQIYLDDTASVQRVVTEGDLSALCSGGGTAQGDAIDRNVDLVFRMP